MKRTESSVLEAENYYKIDEIKEEKKSSMYNLKYKKEKEIVILLGIDAFIIKY